MGCFCLKGVFVKQPKKSEKPLFIDTLAMGDVVVELDNGNNGANDVAFRFEEKHESEQEEILKYLYKNWKDLEQDSLVIEALKQTRFVKGADGNLYKPKDLFEPGDTLLKSLFSGEAHKFPGKRFVSRRWLKILRNTGLRNTRDADAHTMLECARRVEFLGKEIMKHVDANQSILETWSLAETLVKAILENVALLQDHSFCNALGKIACVPAEKGFPLEIGKKTRVVCLYSEVVLMKDWELAWAAAPILSNESLVPPDHSWEHLQLRSPPPSTTVLRHLDLLCKVPCSLSCFLTGEKASFEVLKYLNTNWGTLSSSDKTKLSRMTFISVVDGTLLLSPVRLITHLKINLYPIAFELPLLYLPFVKILKELGLHDTLSVSYAIMFVSTCKRFSLSPNELRAVIQLLNFICDETTKQHKSNWYTELFVPDSDCRLVRPNSCVYIDPSGSRYVKHIDCSKLRIVHPDVSERLCLTFGIRKLSDVIAEELDCAQPLLTLEEIGSVSLAAIRLKLLSRSFQVAVSGVVNNLSSSTTSGFKNTDFVTLQRSLESVAERLQFVQSIHTRIWLLPKSLDITHVSLDSTIPGWEGEPSHRALYYVDRSKTRMLIAEPPSYISVPDLVAIVVSQVLGSPVPLPIGSLFLCPQDSETQLANILKLSCDGRVMDSGTDILPEDAMQVQLRPLRPFYIGEIVAWQRHNGEKLKYGRVTEDVRPSTGQVLYRIRLETSPAKTESIVSSHVFSFGDTKLRNQRKAIKELEHGHVPTNEFVHAVEEILSVAGVSMEADAQCLVQNTVSLEARFKESRAALVLEQEKVNIAREAAEAALRCQICLTDETDTAVVPCGHALCHRCSSHVTCCPFCRVQFSSTIKIRTPVFD